MQRVAASLKQQDLRIPLHRMSRTLRFEGLEQRAMLAVDLDDSISEAIALGAASATTPATVSDIISPDVDVDMYKFSVTAAQVVDFDIDTVLNGAGGLGSYIRLFNAQGTQLASNDDGMAPGENSFGYDAYLRYTFPTAGTYYLGVSNFNNALYNPVSGDGDTVGGLHATGTYHLTVQALPIDPDDSLSEAAVLGAITSTPITTSASINPDIDVDMVRFTVTANQVIDFDIDTALNGPGGLGSYIRLFNAQGTEIASNDDGAAPGETVGFDSYLRYTFGAGGTYYLGVSNFTNSSYDPSTGNGDTAGGLYSIGSYQLIVQAIVAPPNDTDDAISEANLLGAVTTTPISVSYSISPDVDVDMFRFSVTASQVVDFDIDTALNGAGGLGSYIRLFNAQGVPIAINDDGMAPGENTVGFDSYLRYTFATTGTYYLGVSNYNNATYDPIAGTADTSGGLHTTGDYQLIVQALPIDPDDSLSEAALLGPITSSPITTSASITPDIDVDMFRFTVTATQVVDFDIDTVLNGPGGLGSYIRLFNSQGVQIAFNNDGAAPDENGVGFDSYLRYTFEAAGTYYLGVSNVNNASYDPITGNGDTAGGLNSIGSYQLIVQAILPANDPDDTIGEANALGAVSTTPITISNGISPDIDVDMYKFNVSMGQVVDFDIDTPINGPGGLGSYLRLFNAQGVQLAFNDDAAAPGESSVGFDAYLRYTFVNAGTYYLGLSNANNSLYNAIVGDADRAGGSNTVGNYQLIVQAIVVPPNETGGTFINATSLGAVSTSPISVSESISPDVDVDMFRFTVTAGQVVDFDIDTVLNGQGGLGSFLRLFDSQGLLLAFNNDAAAPGENTVGFDAYLRYTFATAGTYYLGVSNANNTLYNPLTGAGSTAGGLHSTGAYQLTLQALPIDVDDTLSEATLLGAITSTPITTNEIISPDIDVDMVRFTVTAGQIVDFDIDTAFNGPGGLGSFIRLFNSAGTQLDFNNDAAAPGESTVGFDAYLRYTFAAAGTYYLGVSNANNASYDPVTGNGDTSGGQNSTGSYQLIVQAIVAPTNDPDDAISEANVLGTASTTPISVSNSISPDNDVDMFRFTVTANQIVDFDIDTVLNGAGGLGSYIRLFDAQGTQLAFNNDAAAPGETVGIDSYLRYAFTTAGTYYLGVSNSNNASYDPVTGSGDTAGGSNATGTYQLIVQAVVISANDPDDSISEANALGVVSTTPISVSTSISPDIDVDMFQVDVASGQVVDFDIDTTNNGSGGLGSYIRLFNAQGVELAFNDDAAAPDENAVGLDAYLRYTFPFAGKYFIGVSNNNNGTYDPITGNGDRLGGLNSTGAYQLTLQALPIDPDDSLAESNFLGAVSSSPVSAAFSITPDIDVDMFRFTVVANQVVEFDIDTTLNGPGGLGSFIRLFDAQGTQLAFDNDGAAPGETVGFDSYLQHTFAASGTYYLGVSNSNNSLYDPVSGNGDTSGGQNSIGSYQLTVQSIVASANDPDDTVSEANFIGAVSATPFSVSNSISPDVDVDMVRFSVTAGQIVDFDIDTALNGAGGLGSTIRLFNAQGTELAANNNAAAPGENSVGVDAYLRYTFTTAGTFFLGVSNDQNVLYDPISGNGDTAGGPNSTGAYQLIVQSIAVGPPLLMLTINPTSIPEVNGVATGRVSRVNADLGQSIAVTLTSSDMSAATVTNSVVIPANVSFVDFQIFAVHNTSRGTALVTISATAQNFSRVDHSLLITDSDLTWHNFANPNDVDNDGSVSPLDVLSIINYLNVFGAGNVPAGSPPPYLDVNGDNQISPLDGLEVINFLNRVGSGEGENASRQVESVPSKSQRIDEVYMQYGQDFFTDFEFLGVRGSRLRRSSAIH